jgi:homoserine/homoserine lactone efflux protein
MEFPVWLAFFAASWAISLSPGPGAVAAMSAGVSHGFWRGYVLTFGLILGIVTQLLVVAVGLGVLIAASGAVFTAVKWAGVAYLLWLGVQQWRAGDAPVAGPDADTARTVHSPRSSPRDLLLRGWVINALNPKGTVFMLAVVPQFLDPAQPLALQYAVIGATLAFTDLVVMAGYTLLAARVLGSLRSAVHRRWLNRTFGSLFVLAALLLASFKRS